MFKKLLKKLRKVFAAPINFDPARLNDEIALQAEWSPLSEGGTSFQTHQLVTVNENSAKLPMSKKTNPRILIFVNFLVHFVLLFSLYYTLVENLFLIKLND